MESTLVDSSDLAAVKATVRPNTKLIHIETPANPTLIISDIRAISDITHQAGAVLGA